MAHSAFRAEFASALAEVFADDLCTCRASPAPHTLYTSRKVRRAHEDVACGCGSCQGVWCWRGGQFGQLPIRSQTHTQTHTRTRTQPPIRERIRVRIREANSSHGFHSARMHFSYITLTRQTFRVLVTHGWEGFPAGWWVFPAGKTYVISFPGRDNLPGAQPIGEVDE